MKIIAHIYNGLSDKFGVPRQSGLADIKAKVVFEPEYRIKEAFRGLEGYSYIWIIWSFSKSIRDNWSPTVRPPRLGGNIRKGVFATRSPFRPNSIGLSSVKLEKIDMLSENAPVLYISGCDMMNGTPVYDIKPYLSYTDSHSDAMCGFTDSIISNILNVVFLNNSDVVLSKDEKYELIQILSHDPRPSYQNEPERIYGISYSIYNIRFYIKENNLYVISVDAV